MSTSRAAYERVQPITPTQMVILMEALEGAPEEGLWDDEIQKRVRHVLKKEGRDDQHGQSRPRYKELVTMGLFEITKTEKRTVVEENASGRKKRKTETYTYYRLAPRGEEFLANYRKNGAEELAILRDVRSARENVCKPEKAERKRLQQIIEKAQKDVSEATWELHGYD